MTDMLGLEQILFVSRARLRQRAVLVQELLAILGIAIGVALLFASQVASQSLDGSVRQLTRQLVGRAQYQLDARSSAGFPEAVATEVSRLPGVRAALPLLEQSATVVGPSGRASVVLIGANPKFAQLGGRLLKTFSAKQLANQRAIALPDPIAASIGAQALQVIGIQNAGRQREVLVGTTLGEREVGNLAESQLALAPLAYAQTLTGTRGSYSRVFVQSNPGEQAAVEAGLRKIANARQLNLEPADYDTRLFAVAFKPAEQSEALFSLISAFIGFLFAFTAMLLTVPERRRLIEAMRRLGYSRTSISQVLAFDAIVIGVIACLLGLAVGEVLSRDVFRAQPGYLSFAFPVGSPRVVTSTVIAEATAVGLIAAFIGVFAPVRDILARPLRSAIERDRPPRGWQTARLTAGLACLATTTMILAFQPRAALLGSIALIIAMLASLPLIFGGLVNGLERVQRRLPVTSTRLAIIELKDPVTRVRSLAVAATGAIAVFGSVAITGAQHNLQRGLDQTAYEWNHATDLWVSPAGVQNTLGTTTFPATVASSVRHLAGVRSVSFYRGSFLNVRERRAWVIAPPRTSTTLVPAGQLVDGNARTVNERLRNGGWVVLSEAMVRELHLHIGSFFTLPAPNPRRFRIAGVSTNGGWPPGVIVINAEDYAHAWGSSAASALNIDTTRGAPLAGVEREVSSALRPYAGLEVQTASQRTSAWRQTSRHGLARLTEIANLVLGAAILAMAGVIASMIWQRRDRIAYIRRQGFTRGMAWRIMFAESAILLLAGCLIGAAFGLYGQLLLSHALTTVTGFPLIVGVGPMIALTSVGLVTASALLIVAVPGYFAARVRATMLTPA